MDRERMLARLADETFDLLVISGGITGAGVAREVALRGLKAAVVEHADFAYGTSSRSTKLIHGGLRYLRNMEFRLVREAVEERQRLIRMAPHLVHPLPFAFPVYAGDPDPPWKLKIGLVLYDWFAGSSNVIPHRVCNAAQLREQEPVLKREGLVDGAIYGDCATDDGRLVLEVIRSAVEQGVVAANYAEAIGLVKNSEGRVTGARVRNRLTGDDFEVRAGLVLNAAGPWVDHVRRQDDPGLRPLIASDASDPSVASRDYQLFPRPSGMITVGGGKLTAFRAMASHVVDQVFPQTKSPTHLEKSMAPRGHHHAARPAAGGAAGRGGGGAAGGSGEGIQPLRQGLSRRPGGLPGLRR